MEPETDTSTPPQVPRSKRPRRWPVVLLIVVVVLAAGAGIAWYQLGGKLKSTEPYKAAFAQVRQDPQVIAQLGEPVRDVEFLPSGSVYGDKASLMFRIAGPKGRASVRAEARRIGGRWALSALAVTTADQKRILLDVSSGEAGEGDAPKWMPPAGAAPRTGGEVTQIPPPASPGPDIQLDMPDLSLPEKAPSDSKTPPRSTAK